MEPEDLEDTMCTECGATVDPADEPVFSVTPEIVLCRECSVRRGGVWDEAHSRWTKAPRLEGLPRPVGTEEGPRLA